MTGARLRCAVPFCTHTRGRRKGEAEIERGQEWVCGDHWRLVRKSRRRAFRRAARRAEAAWGLALVPAPGLPAEGGPYFRIGDVWRRFASREDQDEFYAAMRAARRVWERAKREAIERAAGL